MTGPAVPPTPIARPCAEGPWSYDDTRAARRVGIHQVRPACWAARPFDVDEVPAAVAETFRRGGLNLQRIRAAGTDAASLRMWTA